MKHVVQQVMCQHTDTVAGAALLLLTVGEILALAEVDEVGIIAIAVLVEWETEA